MSWLKKQRMVGYLFILPSLLGVTIFFLIPLIFSFGLAFTDWVGPSGKGTEFIGLANFYRLFNDDIFYLALKNNLIYIFNVPISVFLGFFIAVILNKHVFMKNTLRAIFFLPYLVSSIAIGFVWMLLFHPTDGPINQFLLNIGFENVPGWLSTTRYSMPAIMIISIWQQLGFNVIIYLAALQDVPKELEEAAMVDGANRWQVIRNVTLPSVSPITFFLLVVGILNAFKSFGLIQAVTEGGPANSTLILPLYVYQTAFRYYEMGYASSIAVMLFIIIFIITAIQWYGQKKWVHY